jgi:hypothetical protein
MVADVDGIDLAFGGGFELGRQRAGPIFDLAKRPQDLAARVENRRGGSFAGERFLPRGQQGVVRFHPLRESRSAPKFATRFQT